jgi:hypothetical protein
MNIQLDILLLVIIATAEKYIPKNNNTTECKPTKLSFMLD